jgi:hypothetical protein
MRDRVGRRRMQKAEDWAAGHESLAPLERFRRTLPAAFAPVVKHFVGSSEQVV